MVSIKKGSISLYREIPPLVYKTEQLKANALMEHIQAFVHKHVHLWSENMYVTVKIQELF